MLEVGTLITGVITGPIIGLFMVGMLLPSVNNTGALTSFIGSILLTRLANKKNFSFLWTIKDIQITFTSWIAVGGRVYKTASPYTSITAPPAPRLELIFTSFCPILESFFWLGWHLLFDKKLSLYPSEVSINQKNTNWGFVLLAVWQVFPAW